MRTMLLIVAAGLAGILGAASPAQAQFYRWGYFGRPVYRPSYGYDPWPYYRPPPLVYAPPPIVYAPAPRVVYVPLRRWCPPRRLPVHPAHVMRRRPARRIGPKPVNPLLGPLAPTTQTRARLHASRSPERPS